jgi:hypothetical protein
MSRLYDIADQFKELFDRYDDMIDTEEDAEDIEQAWFDTLEGIEGEFECKAESVAQYIKELNAEAEAIKAEEKKLSARRKAKENAAIRMKDYLKSCMETMNLKKVETAKAKISIRNNAPTLKIDNEAEFIMALEATGRHDLLKYSAPEIKKTDIKNLIKSGETFTGARLEASQSVIIG